MEQDLTEYAAALVIGEKIIEMADRLARVHAIAPGAQGRWAFDMDDKRFIVVVTQEKTP